MIISDLLAIPGEISIRDAFERVLRSGKSVLLIRSGETVHLYEAETLHLWSTTHPTAPVAFLARTRAPDLLAEPYRTKERIELLGVSGDYASVRVGSCVTSITDPNGGAELYER
jgi:hypothetical protein